MPRKKKVEEVEEKTDGNTLVEDGMGNWVPASNLQGWTAEHASHATDPVGRLE